MKSNSVMKRSIVGEVISWMFRDGVSISFDAAEISPEIRDKAMLHGFSQKIADAAAMSVDPETGKPATIEAKRGAMENVIEALRDNRWNIEREGGEGGMLLEALVRFYAVKDATKTRESIAAHLATLTEKQKTALRNKSEHLKPYLDEIRAERGRATGVDGDELLETFDSTEADEQ